MTCDARRHGRVLGSWLLSAIVLAGCAGVEPTPRQAPLSAPGTAHVQQSIGALPRYAPVGAMDGNIRLWGHGSFKHDFMSKLVDAWVSQFKEHHPAVTFDYQMYGTASAVGAVYTDAGDIAILGEEISPAAARAFRRAKGYAHTDIAIATGSVDVNYFDYAHMIFVHKDNPIERLSLAQLDAIFGAEHRRGSHNIRSWDQLGLGGDWAGQLIRPHGWNTDVDFALFFRERVMRDSHRWNPNIREYVHQKREDGSQYDHGQQILDALANDRHGIAISNVRYANAQVKALPLAWEPNGPYYPANVATLVSQDYPLVRIIPAIVDQPPGQRLKPVVREFLLYILSRDGQQALVDNSGYLPLSKDIVERQRRGLK